MRKGLKDKKSISRQM